MRLTAFLLSVAGLALAQAPQPDGAGLEPGVLPAKWLTGGPRCMEQPDWQVHEYNAGFYIIRESGCVNYEKPFLYLIFGRDKALLVDTGAGATNVGSFVGELLRRWCERSKRESIPLLVVHSHGHGDHTSGDAQFRGRDGVELIPADVEALRKAFSIVTWPADTGLIDLGGRLLDVVPIPGHHPAAIALYDRQTGILLTGDSVYPGRLYVSDWTAFAASTKRLAEFVTPRLVSHILGCHIEQSSTPFLEYPIGSIYQPSEHVLQLSRGDLFELNMVLQDAKDQPRRIALRSMTVYPMDAAARQELRRVQQETQARQEAAKYGQPAQ